LPKYTSFEHRLGRDKEQERYQHHCHCEERQVADPSDAAIPKKNLCHRVHRDHGEEQQQKIFGTTDTVPDLIGDQHRFFCHPRESGNLLLTINVNKKLSQPRGTRGARGKRKQKRTGTADTVPDQIGDQHKSTQILL
jgi:hypothetical protein